MLMVMDCLVLAIALKYEAINTAIAKNDAVYFMDIIISDALLDLRNDYINYEPTFMHINDTLIIFQEVCFSQEVVQGPCNSPEIL